MKNEKGITLVELLATLTFMSLIIILISSVLIFGQKQFNNQTEQIDHQANVRLAMSTVMKEIRTAGDEVVINSFSLDGSELKVDDTTIVDGIQCFVIDGRESGDCPLTIEQEEVGDKIEIAIVSVPDSSGTSASLSSEVYIRNWGSE